MKLARLHWILTCFITAVWLVNGLFCKVLNLVPRHQQIVGAIVGDKHSRTLTVLIGVSEIFMAIWILSRLYPRINAIVQILIVGLMNTIEFLFVPELLLWGRLNAFFAFLFMMLIFYNEFYLSRKFFLKR